MSTHPLPIRSTAFAVFLLHFVVAGGATVADASLELASLDDVVHVEGESERPCSPGHDHVQCQLCRALAWHYLGAPGGAEGLAGPQAPSTPAAKQDPDAPGSAAHLLPAPRGPPPA